ncbi:MAG: hypothetical protein ABI867_26590 [Kofleriaceae bacterium]
MRTAIIVALVAVTGFALVELRIRTTPTPAPQPAASTVAQAEPPAQSIHVPVLAAQPAVAPVTLPPVSQTRRDAEALIAAAIARGQWKEQDRDAFAVLARELTGEERVQVVQPLVIAVNAQRLELPAGDVF